MLAGNFNQAILRMSSGPYSKLGSMDGNLVTLGPSAHVPNLSELSSMHG